MRTLSASLLFFCFVVTAAHGQRAYLDLSTAPSEVKVMPHAQIFIDSTRAMTWEEVSQQTFRPMTEDNFGLTQDAYWIKIPLLSNRTPAEKWIVDFKYPLLDSISFMLLQNGTVIQHSLFGDALPFDNRPINHRTISVPIRLEPFKPYELVIRVSSESTVILDASIYQPDAFYMTVADDNLLFGLLYGVFVVMWVYNLFIFFSLKDWNYFLYSLCVFGIAAFFSSFYGHSYQHLIPQFTFLSERSVHLSMGFLIFSNALFARRFLELRKYSSLYDTWNKYISWFGLLAMASAVLVPFRYNAQWITYLVIATVPGLILGGYAARVRGNKAARFYVIGWLPFLMGALLLVFRNLGMLPVNSLTSNGMLVGSTFQVIFLSIALGDRYRIIKEDRERVQEENTRILKEFNSTKEQKVRDRTEALEESQQELKRLRETVQHQSDRLDRRKKLLDEAIEYTAMLQEAVFPTTEKLELGFPQHFVFEKPLREVSGDFYWSQEHEGLHFLAVGDCTGHGIPGALLTLVASHVLDQLVREGHTQPDQMLADMHAEVKEILLVGELKAFDTMDVGLAVYNPSTKELLFAGARCAMTYITNHTIQECKGDRQMVAGPKTIQYTLHRIAVVQTTMVYLYSDGFRNQFGGVDGKKYKQVNLNRFFHSIHQLPCTEQWNRLAEEFEKWKGEHPQLDDVLILGFQID